MICEKDSASRSMRLRDKKVHVLRTFKLHNLN
ncbi:UNVERIFIED_CONTAM: hypothetical protein GTU68_063277 [Idotea baltica]|nr:hypothetical protein [Idotea baltica]